MNSKMLGEGQLKVHFKMGRTAVSKHLAILKDADFVKDRKVGREKRYRLNAEPLMEIDDWVSYYKQFWNESAERLSQLLEGKEDET